MGAQADQAMPPALKDRQKVVTLDGGKVILIERWPIAKLITMTSWLTNNLKDASRFFTEDSAKLNAFEFAQSMLEGLGDKLPQFLTLAIGPAASAEVMELPADEAFEVLVEIIKLNVSDKLVKKVKELLGLFKSRFQEPNSSKST